VLAAAKGLKCEIVVATEDSSSSWVTTTFDIFPLNKLKLDPPFESRTKTARFFFTREKCEGHKGNWYHVDFLRDDGKENPFNRRLHPCLPGAMVPCSSRGSLYLTVQRSQRPRRRPRRRQRRRSFFAPSQPFAHTVKLMTQVPLVSEYLMTSTAVRLLSGSATVVKALVVDVRDGSVHAVVSAESSDEYKV